MTDSAKMFYDKPEENRAGCGLNVILLAKENCSRSPTFISLMKWSIYPGDCQISGGKKN